MNPMTTTLVLACLVWTSTAEDRADVIVAVGAAGAQEYGDQFGDWAGRWHDAAERGHAVVSLIGDPASTSDDTAAGEPTDRERLESAIGGLVTTGRAPVWIVLIGHGTFDGKAAKFNLRGPDLEVGQIANWLSPFERPVVVINCSSASGPFIKGLSKKGRIVITATRSGDEQNFARFGDYMSAAITNPEADLDKDDQISVLEAFLTASKRVEEFYKTNGRLATEHALLDDNGDGLGIPADWFRGVRAVKRPNSDSELDGAFARQIHLIESDREAELSAEAQTRRDELERELETLREQKDRLDEAEYFAKLQEILVELSRISFGEASK